ncbi:hypothetical protein MNB_SV-6-842 [hydrothermal vent metagenome]|uniref:Uncharacterized protein n=1 Tax=hydrothermal vent metagenome TaxID=652676 RepID=A0A1W1BIT0_9ZZZZ
MTLKVVLPKQKQKNANPENAVRVNVVMLKKLNLKKLKHLQNKTV